MKDKFLTIQYECKKQRFGQYEVALENISDSAIVYSFGVGWCIKFDIGLINKFGMKIHAFDPTPDSISWIKRQNTSEKLRFYEFGLADFDGSISLHPNINPKRISHSIYKYSGTIKQTISGSVKRLDTIMGELGHTHIDILKMDIEGAEYQVIKDLKNTNIRPTQILLEFHHFFNDELLQKTKNAIITMREMGYKTFSISENAREFNFIYKPLI
jgi:FkbM family methyltransferase